MILLTKTELIKELKKVNKERLNIHKDFQNGKLKEKFPTEEDFQIEYFSLLDKLDNWQKYYKIK